MSSKPPSGHFKETNGDKKYKEEQAKKNKQNHIFGQSKHNFNDLLKTFNGDSDKAYETIQNEANRIAQKLPDGITTQKIIINGIEVTIKGLVKDKEFFFGTSYIEGE